MDLSLTAEDLAFRDEVRTFIAAELRPEWRGVSELPARSDLAATLGWQQRVAEKGWLTTGWPERYGGRQLTPMQRYIFNAETARVRAPLLPHMAFGMVAPLIYTFGSPAQQDRFLPRILSGEDIWAQGFSEPGAGSDLASLRTTARRDGDHYIVDGQKIWTTNAHIATELFCLVRTDPAAAKPQQGISMILIPMDLPGISVRPIRTIDGQHHFNEVFLDFVRVPAERLLGEENKGWSYAKALLAHERQGIAEVQPTRVILEEVKALISARDEALADDAAALEIELDSLEMMELRFMAADAIGNGRGHDASLLKILGSRLRQSILDLGVCALGPLGRSWPGPDAPVPPGVPGGHIVSDAIFYRAATIYGGSTEVQRNIVAKLLLDGNVSF